MLALTLQLQLYLEWQTLCKNLTLRNWINNVWYLCFYDMDTAFKLNNAGADTVKYFGAYKLVQ